MSALETLREVLPAASAVIAQRERLRLAREGLARAEAALDRLLAQLGPDLAEALRRDLLGDRPSDSLAARLPSDPPAPASPGPEALSEPPVSPDVEGAPRLLSPAGYALHLGTSRAVVARLLRDRVVRKPALRPCGGIDPELADRQILEHRFAKPSALQERLRARAPGAAPVGQRRCPTPAAAADPAAVGADGPSQPAPAGAPAKLGPVRLQGSGRRQAGRRRLDGAEEAAVARALAAGKLTRVPGPARFAGSQTVQPSGGWRDFGS